MVEEGLPNSEDLETPETPENTGSGELEVFVPSGEIDVYVPRGHSFSVYSLDENLTLYLTVFGAALVTFAIVVILMNSLGGDRYG